MYSQKEWKGVILAVSIAIDKLNATNWLQIEWNKGRTDVNE
jgi:hypothetical protein